MARFKSKPPKHNQSCLRDEERLVSGQTSKETIEALAQDGGWKRLGKKGVIDVEKIDWMLDSSIGHDPSIYIEESGLISVGHIPKM
jgi:hypothetical protein